MVAFGSGEVAAVPAHPTNIHNVKKPTRIGCTAMIVFFMDMVIAPEIGLMKELAGKKPILRSAFSRSLLALASGTGQYGTEFLNVMK